MPNPNLSVDLTQAEKDAIIAKFNEVKALLPFLVNLTPSERKKLFKMGPDSVSYVQLCLQVAQQHPEILPSSFDVGEFTKDVSLNSELNEINIVSNPIAEGIGDTMMQAGIECMRQSNTIYELVKTAAKRDSNFDTIKQQLAERYNRAGSPNGKSVV